MQTPRNKSETKLESDNPYYGITYSPSTEKFVAFVVPTLYSTYIGHFATIDEAIAARSAAMAPKKAQQPSRRRDWWEQ